MKTKYLIFLAALIGLASCSSQGGSSTSSSSTTSSSQSTSSIVSSEESSSTGYDLTALQNKYGTFKVNGEAFAGDTYTISVAETKVEYVLQGYFSGKIVIDNSAGLSSYKGVKLTLEGACLVGEGADPVIDFTLDSKNVQISAKSGTENYILALGTGTAVNSENNIELSGKGELELCSSGGESHVFRADGKITISGSLSITISKCAHDAFHGNNLYTTDEDEEVFSGSISVKNCASQAFDFETKSGNGTIAIDGGTILVDGADGVFKTDKSLIIASGATVTATNIADSAVIQGDASSGLDVVVDGKFTVDGKDYQS